MISDIIEKDIKVSVSTNSCPKCKVGLMSDTGYYIAQTYTIPRSPIGTVSYGGPGKLRPCLKCLNCGFSITK